MCRESLDYILTRYLDLHQSRCSVSLRTLEGYVANQERLPKREKKKKGKKKKNAKQAREACDCGTDYTDCSYTRMIATWTLFSPSNPNVLVGG